MIRRGIFALIVGGVLPLGASAQDVTAPRPAPNPSKAVYPTPQAPAKPNLSDVPPPPPRPVEISASRPDDPAASARRSIARPAPPPRRVSSTREVDSIVRRDSEAVRGQFANPGGVGRYAEYYTANTPTSQVDLRPRPLARFDRGGGPDRTEQIAAFRAGQLRARNIQDNINAYGRPYGAYGAGFGFGFGLGAGGLYGGGLR